MDRTKLPLDIGEVLDFLATGIDRIFTDKLVGFYLTGSLSYGDFDPGRSDIDLLVVLETPVTDKEALMLQKLHEEAEAAHPAWRARIECSYVPRAMLSEILPPKQPRPYVGAGIFYPQADYGNEWIINQYFLYRYALPLRGPEFRTLLERPVEMAAVQAACRRDLYREWAPMLDNPSPLADPHVQSYVILNLCRILYTVRTGQALSKRVACQWAKEEYPRWAQLIGNAEKWIYGDAFDHRGETLSFIHLAMEEIPPETLAGR
jgi:hypothetical protein